MCTLFEEGNVNVDSKNSADEPKLRLTRFSPIEIESDVIDRVYGRKVNKAQQKKAISRDWYFSDACKKLCDLLS